VGRVGYGVSLCLAVRMARVNKSPVALFREGAAKTVMPTQGGGEREVSQHTQHTQAAGSFSRLSAVHRLCTTHELLPMIAVKLLMYVFITPICFGLHFSGSPATAHAMAPHTRAIVRRHTGAGSSPASQRSSSEPSL
jgi:hypothetical protein